jgi:nucleoside-diphosphate-sugar epimerase
MRVFVTGASGHIGSAVVPELIGAGHQVVGLARSDESAAKLEAAGAEAVRGNLDDIDTIKQASADADGVIHLAFNHEWMRTGGFGDAIEQDTKAVQAISEALAGSGKPFVGTSGTLMLAMNGISDRLGTENDAVQGEGRVATENAIIALADQNIRSSVVRLPPTVHSYLDKHGFIPVLIGIAREKGVAGYVGDGANRWPAGHTLDAAVVYRLALEQAPAGTRLHATGDEGVPFKEIAAAIGKQLDVPAESVSPDDAAEHFSFLGGFVSLDGPVSNARTREVLGWEPTHETLLEDLAEDHYFEV